MRTSIRRSLIVALHVCVVLLVSVAQQPATAQQAEIPVIARVTVRDQTEADQIVRLGVDLLEARDGDDLFILTTQNEIDRVRALGFHITIDQEQTAQLQRAGHCQVKVKIG